MPLPAAGNSPAGRDLPTARIRQLTLILPGTNLKKSE
jgi:hypothetical protein